jgi:hypothetical protein
VAILLRQSSARPRCQRDFEAAVGGVERIAEQLPELADPVADGLRVDVQLGGDAGRVALVGEACRLVTGGVGWPELLWSGKLEMSGDPFLALRFPNRFRLPAARS